MQIECGHLLPTDFRKIILLEQDTFLIQCADIQPAGSGKSRKIGSRLKHITIGTYNSGAFVRRSHISPPIFATNEGDLIQNHLNASMPLQGVINTGIFKLVSKHPEEA